MGDDRVAVANLLTVIDNVGQLTAWRCRSVEWASTMVVERLSYQEA